MSSAQAPRVQTVLGPVDPSTLGFTLPHEHTAITLWQIPNRWDYWELTWDEPIITAELARFRAAGGSTLVDVTLPGVGRDPGWLVAIARGTGLNVVMGCGWYREAYYPAEALIDRRSVDDLADELVREAEEGIEVDGAGAPVRPGIIGEIGTDKPWLSAQEERVHRAVARASIRTGLAITTHAVMSDVGLAQLAVFDAEGADLSRGGHRSRRFVPSLDHYLEIIRRGASIEFDFLGMTFTRRSATANRASSTCCWNSSPAGTLIGSSSVRTSATTRSSSTTLATATRTSRIRSSRGFATAACPPRRSINSRSRTRGAS